MSSTQPALGPSTSPAYITETSSASDPPSSSILSTPPTITTTPGTPAVTHTSLSPTPSPPSTTTPTPTSITSPIPASTRPTSAPSTSAPPSSTPPTSIPPTPTPPTPTPSTSAPASTTPPTSTPSTSTPSTSTPSTSTPSIPIPSTSTPTSTPSTSTPPIPTTTSTPRTSIFTPSSTTSYLLSDTLSSSSPPSHVTDTDTQSTTITVITSLSVATSNGQTTTVTDISTSTIPPAATLSHTNDSQANATFFRKTGAVAGVFILVGLAVASIILWIFLAIRRRRRTQRLELDAAVAATLNAAGFRRTPLEDEDDDFAQESGHSRYGSSDPFLHQRRSLALSSLRSGGPSAAFPDVDNDPHIFHPYSDLIHPAVSPPFITRPYRTRSSSNNMGEDIPGHTPQHSGSHEPLLASYNRSSPSPTGDAISPKRLSNAANNALFDQPQQSNLAPKASSASSGYSSEGTGDHRLDPNLRQRFQDDADSFRDLRDDKDYSRPVLGVRNMPDASSQVSLP